MLAPKTQSLLPNKLPDCHGVVVGPFGHFETVWCEDLDTHVLVFVQGVGQYKGTRSVIASHHNGHSCRELALRIVRCWARDTDQHEAMMQADYIQQCGGTAARQARIKIIASPETWKD